MAKYRKFKNVYVISIEGRTSNGFMASLIDEVIKSTVTSIVMAYYKLDVQLTVKETIGEYNAKTEQVVLEDAGTQEV